MSDTRTEYWLGITECECNSPHPIGACLRCDLLEIKRRLEELEASNKKALKALKAQHRNALALWEGRRLYVIHRPDTCPTCKLIAELEGAK